MLFLLILKEKDKGSGHTREREQSKGGGTQRMESSVIFQQGKFLSSDSFRKGQFHMSVFHFTHYE